MSAAHSEIHWEGDGPFPSCLWVEPWLPYDNNAVRTPRRTHRVLRLHSEITGLDDVTSWFGRNSINGARYLLILSTGGQSTNYALLLHREPRFMFQRARILFLL